jgi:O-acetyl-ADP-ribose deacetylase (regulator of RNase III)
LKKCNSSGQQSIAFPAIGTGVLGFPHDEAAKIFFEEAKRFGKTVSSCKMKQISFVVFNKDAKSVQSFQNELKKQPEWGSSSRSSKAVSGESQKRWKRNPSTTEYDSKGVMCIQVGDDKEIEIVKSDITKETTHVIAHLTNPLLFMGSGVATALAKAGGQEIERACEDTRKSYTKLQVATTVLTTAGRLDAKYIAHMVAPNGPSSSEIEKCIASCLKTVSENECESVSFPAVGTGSLRHDPEKAATTILTPMIRFLESSSGPLKTIRVVLREDEIVTAFQASAKKFLDNEGPGMFRRLMNLIWKSESTTVTVKEIPPVITKKLFLEIFGKDDATVNFAREKILSVIESQKKKDKLEDNNIVKLSKQQITEIKHLGEMNNVEVNVEKELNRITLFGHREDTAKMSTEIMQILKRNSEAEKEREKAALQADLADIVSQGVQWFYKNPKSGDYDEYHKHTNAIIEKAYSKKENSVIFVLDYEKCEIVFDKMRETNLETMKKMEVIRKDLKGISIINVALKYIKMQSFTRIYTQ